MKKNIIIVSFTIIISSLFIFLIGNCISSCSKRADNKFHECNDFLYILKRDANGDLYAKVVGVSDILKKEETIVIPTILDNYEVKEIGYYLANRGGLVSKKRFAHEFSSRNKNIYIHSNIIFSNLDGGVDSKFFNQFDSCFYSGISDCLNNSDIKEIYGPVEYDLYNYQKANIVYYLNNGTNEPFFVDNCADSIVNVLPPDPIRDGYKFAGWYKESDCLNKWDFENDVVNSETKIYAKWEKES